MPLDGNNSNIRKQTKVFNIGENTQFSARTIVKIESNLLDSSIQTGDVIRYDSDTTTYVRSFADRSSNAEVFGILESFNADGSGNVVTNGSITIDSNKLINISGINSGGNDIYFLSGISAGKLQNCGPTLYGHIIKPVYQIAPHNQYTGIFKNYLGYAKERSIENLIIAGNTTNDKFLLYNPLLMKFFVKGATYNTNTYTFSNLYSFSISSLPQVRFDYTQDYDATISDDGRHILIFAKLLNKIYHIYSDPNDSNIFKLMASLDVNLEGTSEDKLWANDNEAGSFVVSSKALNRIPSSNNDVRHLSPSISSKIKYYKRSIDTTRPFTWRKTHENHAFGFTKDDKTDFLETTENNGNYNFRDSVFYTTGIYRTNDIRCHRKNYTLSTIALKDDQILYKSKDYSLKLPRYSSIVIPSPKTSMTMFLGITGSIKTTQEIQSSEIYCSDYIIPTDRKYALNGHNKSFLINGVFSDGKYREDNSYKNLYGFLCTNPKYGPGAGLTAFYSPTGGNETKYLNFARSENGSLGPVLFQNIFTESVDINGTQNICSSAYTTSSPNPDASDICVVAKLYNLNTDNSKRLIIYKYPFYAHSLNTVFDYFEWNPLLNKFIPPDVDNSGKEIYGYLKHFKSSDIPELNAINYIKIFGDNTRSFIFTTSYVIVFLHSNSSFIKINLNEDFTKAKHIFTAENNFFILNSKIYRYNLTNQSLEQIQIINL